MRSRRAMLRAWVVALALLSGFLGLRSAASGTNEQTGQSESTEVTADRMVSETRGDQIIFSGNVEVHRGDLVVKADRLEVTQERQSKQVSQMVAIGNVQISKGEQAAAANRATYVESEQKVVLTGNPRAWEGGSEVRGEEMVLLLAEGKMIVIGGAQRVHMIIVPGGTGIKLPTAKVKGQGG